VSAPDDQPLRRIGALMSRTGRDSAHRTAEDRPVERLL
jgi:hypothetical protein